MWILGVLLGLTAIILFMPLTTIIKFNWDAEYHGLVVELKPFHIKKTWSLEEFKADKKDKAQVPPEPKDARQPKKEKGNWSFWWLWYWWNSRAARRGFKRIQLRNLVWETSFSTGDVALTGVATGVLWAVKGWLLGITSSRFNMQVARVEVWPQWDNCNLQTRFDCIVKTRLVHIIGIGITAAWYFVRYQWLAR